MNIESTHDFLGSHAHLRISRRCIMHNEFRTIYFIERHVKPHRTVRFRSAVTKELWQGDRIITPTYRSGGLEAITELEQLEQIAKGTRMQTDLLSREAGRLTRGMNDKSQLGKYSDLTFANESSIW